MGKGLSLLHVSFVRSLWSHEVAVYVIPLASAAVQGAGQEGEEEAA